jgi:C1A family cysteine protease
MTDENKEEDTFDPKQIKFGYKRGLPDPRDYRYEKAVKIVKLPASADLRPLIKRVKNQGGLGSCVAHGTTSCFEATQIKLSGADFPGSRLEVYENGRILGGYYPGDNGCEVKNGVQATFKYGVAHENLWPYIESKFDDPIPENVAADAVKAKSLNYYLVDSASGYAATLTNIKNALGVTGLPVVFGTPVYNSIFNVGSDGMIPMPSGASVGGHCMLFVGYDDSKSAILTLNSWGTGWGMSGYGWLPYGYVTQGLVRDNWVIATESQLGPTPPTPTPPVAADGTSPAATVLGTDTYMFVQGTDKALYYRTAASDAWKALGGILTSGPAAVTLGNDIYMFVRGTDNALWYRTMANGTWHSLSGILSSAPAAAISDGNIMVFVRGSDKKLYAKTRKTSSGTWGDWTSYGGIIN